MKVKFDCACEVEIVERLDSDDEPVWGSPAFFRKGAEVEFDLIDHPERVLNGQFVEDTTLWNVQFGDGTMGMGLCREWFTIISQE